MPSETESSLKQEEVSEYYGKTLKSNADLATNVCTLGKAGMPAYVKEVVDMIHKDVRDRFYGCGVIAPECITGSHIIDLGSGSGQDCFVLSKLVGEKGVVVGVDMTQQQLETANKYIDYHREQFGYTKSNVSFVQGHIEELAAAGIKSNFYDLVVSNCVINLTTDKQAVFTEAYNTLKVGGELHFSDTFVNTALPEEVKQNSTLWGECISGALYWPDFLKWMKSIGFSRPYLLTAGAINITSNLKNLIDDNAKFASTTYRVFKVPTQRESWLPSGTLIYKGGIPHHEDSFKFDIHHQFTKGEPVPCDSEVVTCVMTSRLADYFEFKQTDEEVEPKPPMDVFKFCEKTKSKSCCC